MGGGRVRHRWVLVGLVSTALCAALAPGASAVVVHTATGRFFGVAPRPGVVVSPGFGPRAHAVGNAATATSTGSLEYHGGPVLHSTRPYLVFWDPSSGIDPLTRALFSRYLTDTAAANALGDDVFGVTREYTDATGYAAAGETYAPSSQAIPDAQPYPASGCSTSTATPTCLTDGQLQAELQRLIAADGLPSGTGPGAPVYFIVTPAAVNICAPGIGCADTDFCAYHANVISNGTAVIYAAIPLLNAVKACQADGTAPLQDPNSNSADVAVDNLSHEYNESISDPNGDAWYDNGSDNEEADYCQAYADPREPVTGTDPHAYAPALGTAPNGSLFDQLIAGDRYYTQSEWSNGAGDCELSPPAGTLGAQLIGPATTKLGVQALFTPTALSATFGVSSTTWSFGDGTGAFSPTPPFSRSHTYGTPGTYTVAVTMVDGTGNVDTIVHKIVALGPPVAAFTQSATLAPLSSTPVRFDASSSTDPNPGGHITRYQWDFGDGFTSSAGPAVSHRYTMYGRFMVKLTVTDSEGDTTTTTHQLKLDVVPEATIRWANAYAVAGAPIRFSGSPTPVGITRIAAYRWQFGAGASASGAHVGHAFPRPGAYRVTLTLTTADGLTSTRSRVVHVHPVEAITHLGVKPAPGNAVRLTATVNGPGTLALAGHRYRLARRGSVSRLVALTARQAHALAAGQTVHLRYGVVFDPLAGARLRRTALLTLVA